MKFETAAQAVARLGVTVRAVQKWAKEGKLQGAQKVGRDWMIPFGDTASTQDLKSTQNQNSQSDLYTVSFVSNPIHLGRCIRVY